LIAAGSYNGLIIAVLPEDETMSVGPRDARNDARKDAHHRVCLLILDDSNSRQRVAEPRSGSPSLVRSRPRRSHGVLGAASSAFSGPPLLSVSGSGSPRPGLLYQQCLDISTQLVLAAG
jgi:hypothetical protein